MKHWNDIIKCVECNLMWGEVENKKLSYRRIAEVVLFLTLKRSDSRSAGQKRILS